MTKEFDCWALILDKIINYFEHKIFKKEDKIKQSPEEKTDNEENEEKEDNQESEEIEQFNLFINREDKKFIIICNNFTNEK